MAQLELSSANDGKVEAGDFRASVKAIINNRNSDGLRIHQTGRVKCELLRCAVE